MFIPNIGFVGYPLAGLCIVISITSCSAAGQRELASAIPTPRTAVDLVLPFDTYDLSVAERKVVDKARFLMLASCTGKFGVRLVTSPLPDRPEPKNASRLDWLGDSQVEIYGYLGPPPQPTMSAGYTSYAVTDDQFTVLEGKKRNFRGKPLPAGGCTGATEALLDQGSLELLEGKPARRHEEQELFILADDAAQAAVSDPRIKAAEREWSDCMKAAGLDYPNISAAVADPRWAVTAMNDQVPRVPVSAAEIATATADAACRTKTNYYGARQAALRDSQQKIIAENPNRLHRIKIINQAQLKNARKFLAGELAVTW